MLYTVKDFQPVGGQVIAHFYDAFFEFWKAGLELDLRQAIRRNPYMDLWIFGHSLGGSIASLAAAWISSLGIVEAERIRFVSFGQPRTGNLKYAQLFDDLVNYNLIYIILFQVPYKYRVVHRGDSITKLPTRIPMLDSTLFHHRYEVFL